MVHLNIQVRVRHFNETSRSSAQNSSYYATRESPTAI